MSALKDVVMHTVTSKCVGIHSCGGHAGMDFLHQRRSLLVTCIVSPVPHTLGRLKEPRMDVHISSDATKVFNSEDSGIGETSDSAHPAFLVCGALP